MRPTLASLSSSAYTAHTLTSLGNSHASAPGPLRFVMPSVRDIIFMFLFWSLLAGSLSNRPLADPDIGWHIRTGEQIVQTHTLPRTDPYSSMMQGHAWFAWEWLYDLALGVLYRAAGLNGVVWLCALIISTTFLSLLSQLLHRGTGLFLAIVLMLLAEAASTIHLFARPHIVSWLFTLLWFVALERYQESSAPRWLLWFFPLSIVFWVNLHGEWLFGLALLAIYVLAGFFDATRESDPFLSVRAFARTKNLAWTFLASCLATLANPFGWKLHLHIYHYLGDRYLMNRIAEFRSPDFHGWAQRCFGFIILLTLLALVGHRRQVPTRHILVVLCSIYFGLLSSRNIPISSILLVLIIGPVLWENFQALAGHPAGTFSSPAQRIVDFSDRMSLQELRLKGHAWPVLFAVLTLLICLNGGRAGDRRWINAQFNSQSVPEAAVDFLASQPEKDPIFSTDTWGGYIIYRLYPHRQVVVDDRHDLYTSTRMRDVLIVLQGEHGWRDILEQWRIRTILIPRGSTLANLLRELPQDWQLTYQDSVAEVFQRK